MSEEEFLEVGARLLAGAYVPEVHDTYTIYPPDLIGADLWCLLTRHDAAGLLVVLRYLMIEPDADHRERAHDAIEMYLPQLPLTASFLAALRVFESFEDDPWASMRVLEHQGIFTSAQAEAVIALARGLGRGV